MDEQREAIRSAIREWIHTQEDSRTATPLQFLMNREDLLADAILALQSTHASDGVGEVERYAKVAECAFDDRPRSRVGHPSHMDWEDGYREGTQAAGSAIRALNPDAPSGESVTSAQHKNP